jgi:hypothetical protein
VVVSSTYFHHRLLLPEFRMSLHTIGLIGAVPSDLIEEAAEESSRRGAVAAGIYETRHTLTRAPA